MEASPGKTRRVNILSCVSTLSFFTCHSSCLSLASPSYLFPFPVSRLSLSFCPSLACAHSVDSLLSFSLSHSLSPLDTRAHTRTQTSTHTTHTQNTHTQHTTTGRPSMQTGFWCFPGCAGRLALASRPLRGRVAAAKRAQNGPAAGANPRGMRGNGPWAMRGGSNAQACLQLVYTSETP